ncbi:MAG: hypothetical protein U1F34_03900 [Gammaproteobacteria bacterium]
MKFAYKLICGLLLSMLLSAAATAADNFDQQLLQLQEGWAAANYQLPAAEKNAAFEKLTQQADALMTSNATRAEPMVWKAIIESTHAGAKGGLAALPMLKDARNLLLKAESTDPKVLSGSVYTSLGSLYYKVPGWPISFGNKSKAEEYLKKALAVNPNGIDPNYFYADYLYQQGKSADALPYIHRALAAADRPGRPLADAGRRKEAAELQHNIEGKLASK